MLKSKLMGEMFKLGIMAAIMGFAMPDLSWAASSDVNDLVHSFGEKQLGAVPYMLSAVCYVGGSFMLVSGALSLKKHAENPAGEAMSKGVARLITGGLITSVPALTGLVSNTLNMSGEEARFTKFSPDF